MRERERSRGETCCVMDTAHKDITADGEEEKHMDRRGERCAAACLVNAEGRRCTRKVGGAARKIGEKKDG